MWSKVGLRKVANANLKNNTLLFTATSFTTYSNYQKSIQLFNEQKYHEALTMLKAIKTQLIDKAEAENLNPTLSFNIYKTFAYCYRQLNLYSAALSVLEEMKTKLHGFIEDNQLNEIMQMQRKWEGEAEVYEAQRAVALAHPVFLSRTI